MKKQTNLILILGFLFLVLLWLFRFKIEIMRNGDSVLVNRYTGKTYYVEPVELHKKKMPYTENLFDENRSHPESIPDLDEIIKTKYAK